MAELTPDPLRTAIYRLIALAMFCTMLYVGIFGNFEAMLQRSLFITFFLLLVFIGKYRKPNKLSNAIDWFLVVISLFPFIYLLINLESINNRLGMPLPFDLVMGAILILLTLEAARRVEGPVMTILTICFLLYNFAGPFMPGFLRHRGFSLGRVLEQQFATLDGIFGMPVGVFSQFIFVFVVFGAFLELSGADKIFLKLAMGLVGNKTGGPALTAVTASGLMGMISGSASANVVGTGTFTIPMMKKLGYQSSFAAAVEAVASSGGAILPPVMGVAAFIMADYIGMPYTQLIVHAAIPGVLYFLGIYFAVWLRSKKLGLTGIPREELPSLKETVKESWFVLLPVLVLVYFLVIARSSPMRSALYALFTLIIVTFIRPSSRFNLEQLITAIEKAARTGMPILATSALAGIIIGAVSLTGLGLRFSNLVMAVGGNNLLLALIFTAIASIILGMGLPQSVCYILLAVTVAPGLVKLGLPLISAHMFIFYFGAVSSFTPPVALAAFAAAGLSGDDPMKVGFLSTRLGIVAFIVPFMFIYQPVLLAVGSVYQIILSFITATVGVFLLAAGLEGYLNRELSTLQRLLLIGAALLLINPGLVTDLVGIGLAIVAYLLGPKRKSPGLRQQGVNN